MMQLLNSSTSTFYYNAEGGSSSSIEGNSFSSAHGKPVICIVNAKERFNDLSVNLKNHVSYSDADSVKLILSFVTGVNDKKSTPKPRYEWADSTICKSKKSASIYFEISDSSSDVFNAKKNFQRKARCLLAQVNYLEDSNEREASRYLMREIEHNLKNRQLMCLNEILDNIELYDLKPRVLVSALRSTYRAKNLLPKWEFVLKYTESRLSEFELDVDSWLMGLNHGR